MPREEVESLFNKYEDCGFARTGSTKSEKVELLEGPLEQFTHEMEPFLRKQGMPVRMNKGVKRGSHCHLSQLAHCDCWG
ncbi:hypothetical protein LWI28_009105 [Acer negundo]|uniref:Large ribosomal subunit protein uL10-like insertion domain-containing protein n=1 Tax=Acer negundo TaxID=4023 RepID=A0AAD5ID28_ACENE|nr:hypothetical protein LWI28_009105 [Acer negundo]